MSGLNLFVKDIPPLKPDEIARKWFVKTHKKKFRDFRKPTEVEYLQSLTFIDTPELVYTVPIYE